MTAPRFTDAEIAELRAAMADRAKIRTHSEGCWLWGGHQDCAIHRLLAEIERLRTELRERGGHGCV